MTTDMIQFKAILQRPFPADEIEWRIARSGIKGGKPWAQLFAYITARAVHDRLDEVVGPENWKIEYQAIAVDGKSGFLAGLSIRFVDEDDEARWVTKWDGAEVTDIEALKGGLSDAAKRAAAVWGIGRYLYKLDSGWAEFGNVGTFVHIKDKKSGEEGNFKWIPPALPKWALP